MGKEGLFGDNFKRYRKKRGLSQKQFAQKLYEVTGKKLTLTSISNYETGLHMPPPHILPAIADILQVSIDALFGKKEKAPVSQQPLNQNLIREWKEELEKVEKEFAQWQSRQTEGVGKEALHYYEKLIGLAKRQQEELLIVHTELNTIRELIALFKK